MCLARLPDIWYSFHEHGIFQLCCALTAYIHPTNQSPRVARSAAYYTATEESLHVNMLRVPRGEVLPLCCVCVTSKPDYHGGWRGLEPPHENG
jgi:hypothetical protein